MALKTFVKISNVTNLSDARYCAGMGVDLIGFDINPESETHIPAKKAVEIAEWLAGVEFVAEFHSENISQLKEIIDQYPVSYVEFSHPEISNGISALGLSTIFRASYPGNADLEEVLQFCGPQVDYVFIDDIEDFGDPKVLRELQVYCEKYSVILGGDISPNSILDILEKIPAKGIALKGSEEIKVGYKDYDELADILEVLEDEE